MRRFLFRTVSQIGVNYRDSPLSEGAAGAVRGGDRLPWVETAPDEDNFAPLDVAGLAGPRVRRTAPRAWRKPAPNCGLPLHAFAWQPEMRRSGLMRGALYLVRPDGYVALADPDGDPERLGRYFMSRGLPAALRRDEATRFEPAPVRPGSPGASPWGVGR